MRQSIRARLTAWYAGLTLVALIVMAGTVLALVRHSITRAADDRLAAHHSGLERFANGLETNLTPAEVRDEYREYADVSLGNALIEMPGVNGERLATPDVAGWDAVVAPLHAAAARHAAATTDVLLAGQPYRASTQPLTLRGHVVDAVIAVPMGPADAALARAEQVLFWLLPLMSLVAAACGYVISGRALRPVDRLSLAAQQINVENLHQRLDVPPARDELQRLAVTFNGMLDRLEEGVGNIARFTSEASHELRTPVALIRTTSELALRRERSPAEYQQALADIHTQSREMSDLVDDLLTMARADAGVEEPPRTLVDVAALADAFVTHWRRTSPAIVCVCDTAAPLWVRAEARQVQRLLTIVCENAAKYGPADGTVRVRVHGDPAHVTLGVDDDGVGVAAADLPRVFERFYRGAHARAGATVGSGLGLAIAQVIAHRCGATIAIASPIHASADRPRTRVTVMFPRAEQQEGVA
jgi:two-component system, OmpR family, heavy metal sensor histidine kinase CusS